MANCIGIDLIGNTGQGRDEATAYAVRLRVKYARVSNDIEWCNILLAHGITPLYRVKNQDWDDDDAHRSLNPEVWVDKLHREAPPGCVLYIENECRQEDPQVIAAWMKRVHTRLKQINAGLPKAQKRLAIAYNWAAGNPEPPVLDTLFPVTLEWVKDDMLLGSHEGMLHGAWNTLQEAWGWSIGRQYAWKQRLEQAAGKPVTWIVTEFASAYDAYNGWDVPGWRTAQQTADEWAEAIVWYAEHGYHVIHFTYLLWQNGFKFQDTDVIKNKLVQVQRPVKETTVPDYPPPTSGGVRRALAEAPNNEYVNIRLQPNPNSATSNSSQDVGDLLIGDEVEAFPDAKVGDWIYIKPLNQATRPAGRQPAVNGWVSEQGGKVKLVPPLLPPTPDFVTYPTATITAINEHLDAIQQLLDEGTPSDSGGGF